MKLPELTEEQLNQPFDPALFGWYLKINPKHSGRDVKCVNTHKVLYKILQIDLTGKVAVNIKTGLFLDVTNKDAIKDVEALN